MPALKLSQLVEATGGSLLCGDPETTVDSFAIDTRRMKRGGAFFALKGNQADGHTFVDKAVRAGAAVAVIDHELQPDQKTPPALIRTDDSEAALHQCGHWVRRHAKGVKWIAISGSNGKTTTKEMIAEGLSAGAKVHRTPGNFNNHLGVPLSLLAMPADANMVVLELAMSGFDEIAALTRMVDPDVGILTNIRAVHMASFRSLEDVAAAKGEMFAVLNEESIAVVNLDDAHVRVQATRHVGPQLTFGQHTAAELRMERVENSFTPGAALSFRYKGKSMRVQLRMGGTHSAFNALAALAGVAAAGGNLGASIEQIEKLEAGDGRGRVHRLDRGIVMIDDTYNSSPPALTSMLDTLHVSKPVGRRVLIFGDMLELGPMENALHAEAGRRAAAAGVQVLFAVGPMARETVEAARRAGVPEIHHYNDSTKAADSIGEFLRDGDLVVVKGSRGLHMGKVARELARTFQGAY